MRLILAHPELPTCGECQEKLFDFKAGRWITRGDKPAPRPKGVKPPCGQCPKVPAGEPPVPESAVELNEQNWSAYRHYLECRATGQWPADDRVRRNAAMIRGVEDAVDRGQRDALAGLIAALGHAAASRRTER